MQQLATLAETIQAGAAVGRSWIAEAPLPAHPGVQRWEGSSTVDGTPVEILRLEPEADPLELRSFIDAHQALAEVPAGVPLLFTGADSSIIRPFYRRSLAALERRLSTEEALALAGWYGHAILAMQGCVGGVLTSEEFVVDDKGNYRLAPLGIVGRSPPPIEADLLPAEVRGGGAAEPGTALYGLGVALYRAMTGEDPLSTRDAHGHAMPPAPPSQRQSSPDHRADRVIMALLDPEPARRARALPSAPIQPPRYTPPLPKPPEPEKAEPEPRRQRPIENFPYVVVIVPRGLKPNVMRRAADWMKVSMDTANTIAIAGLPLPVYGAESQSEARVKVNELQGFRAPARMVIMKLAIPLHTTVWAGLIMATGGVAAIAKLPQWVTLAAIGMGILSIPAAILHDLWYAGRVRRAVDMIRESRFAPERAGRTSAESDRLSARARGLKEALSASHLTDHAESDLLNALDITFQSLQHVTEAERAYSPRSPEGTLEQIRAVQLTLDKAMDALEAQLHSMVHQPESTREVELGTLMTRAIAVRKEAEKLARLRA